MTKTSAVLYEIAILQRKRRSLEHQFADLSPYSAKEVAVIVTSVH